MLFDFFYFGITIVCVYVLINKYRNKAYKAQKNILTKLLSYQTICFSVLMILWTCLLVVVPKGNLLHESIRLPRHFWMLNKIEQQAHETINYGEHPNQYCQLFRAKKNSLQKNTIVFFVHGGGWRLGGPHQHHYLADLLTEEGYTVVLAAYRLTPEYSYPDITEDINNALQSSLSFLDAEGMQTYRLVTGGVSAGANLAALLAFDENRWPTIEQNRERLVGVFSLAGVLNLNMIPHSSALNDYTGPREAPNFQKANPINYLNKVDSFELLCIHGNKDGLTNLENARSFAEKKNKIHPESATLFVLDEGTHLDLGAGWYYHEASERGQKKQLLQWLNKLQ